MMSFRGRRLVGLALPAGTAWPLADIAEAEGRQELYTRQSPQALKALRDAALVQSAESSNRIEGVTVDPSRLRPLVIGNARPRDRSEEEVQNYRKALNLIHTGATKLPVTVDTLRLRHRTAREGAGDAGEWKRKSNDIVELHPGHPPRVRFGPVSVAGTPAAGEELCLAYRHTADQHHVPALVLAGCLVLDFLCVHPSRDGNGRVSRLLTLLTLYHHGYEVGRYVSLERLVEDSRDDYYEALLRSPDGWHEDRHDPTPWLNYFLAIVRRAYRVFEERVGQVSSPRGAGRDPIRRVLQTWRQEGLLVCLGRGPGTRWRRKG